MNVLLWQNNTYDFILFETNGTDIGYWQKDTRLTDCKFFYLGKL